jgi:hypothetical protein
MRGFITYALQGLVDGLNEQLDLIQTEQLKVHWRSYIHQVFDDRAGFTAPCKRHLLLDLSDQAAPVPKAELRRLTPRLVEDYHGKTDKTLGRDLNELEEMGLIIIQEGMVQANLNRLVAFLPRLLLVDWD